jgi:hypothetical protein
MAPREYTVIQKKQLVVRVADFQIIAGQLYNIGPDEILRRCVIDSERPLILAEAHEGITIGNYAGKATTKKVLRAGLWWPTLHKDAKEYYRSCDVCQRIGKPSIRDEMPLAPQLTLGVFYSLPFLHIAISVFYSLPQGVVCNFPWVKILGIQSLHA